MPSQTQGGTKPAGVTFSILWVLPPTPGTGTENCSSTCTPCSMQGSVIFNGNGTGWCVTVDTGAGPTIPLPQYARPGKLTANCDNNSCVYVQIVNCQWGGTGAPQYYELHCINCGCGNE